MHVRSSANRGRHRHARRTASPCNRCGPCPSNRYSQPWARSGRTAPISRKCLARPTAVRVDPSKAAAFSRLFASERSSPPNQTGAPAWVVAVEQPRHSTDRGPGVASDRRTLAARDRSHDTPFLWSAVPGGRCGHIDHRRSRHRRCRLETLEPIRVMKVSMAPRFDHLQSMATLRDRAILALLAASADGMPSEARNSPTRFHEEPRKNERMGSALSE